MNFPYSSMHLGVNTKFEQAAAFGSNKPATSGPGRHKLYAISALANPCSTMNDTMDLLWEV
jgi:hypothetical protein